MGEALLRITPQDILDQRGFAAAGGVGKTSQVSYEAGNTAPNVEYLYKLAELGVDIGYVLMGERRSGQPDVEQRLLFESFGRLSAREREAVMSLIMTLAGQTTSTSEISAQAKAARQQLGNMSHTLQDRRQRFKAED